MVERFGNSGDSRFKENSENQTAKKRILTWLNVWTSCAEKKNFETNLLPTK